MWCEWYIVETVCMNLILSTTYSLTVSTTRLAFIPRGTWVLASCCWTFLCACCRKLATKPLHSLRTQCKRHACIRERSPVLDRNRIFQFKMATLWIKIVFYHFGTSNVFSRVTVSYGSAKLIEFAGTCTMHAIWLRHCPFVLNQTQSEIDVLCNSTDVYQCPWFMSFTAGIASDNCLIDEHWYDLLIWSSLKTEPKQWNKFEPSKNHFVGRNSKFVYHEIYTIWVVQKLEFIWMDCPIDHYRTTSY